MREIPAAVTTASRRGRARTPLRAWAVVLVATAAPACKLNQQGVPPPLDRIAFPASALVDPDGRWLYVANSNSDLRYNSGTLVSVDLDATLRDRFGAGEQAAPTWQLCAGADRIRLDSDPDPCCWDYLDRNILDCDERLYIPPDSTVKIGSFSAGMAFQSFQEPACPASSALMTYSNARHDCNTNCPGEPTLGRLFIGVRGDSSLTYVDTGSVADPVLGTRPAFSCSGSTASDARVCQVTQMNSDEAPGASTTPIHVPDEPYALVLDAQQDLLYVGNLRGDTSHPQTGGISLFDVSRPSGSPRAAPTFLGASAAFFNPDVNGNFGITSLTLREDLRQVYASSRYGTNVVNVVPSLDGTCSQDHKDIVLTAGSDAFTTPLIGAEIRGISFLPGGNRAFVLQRVPPALVGFDVSKDPNAFGNFSSEVLETCAAPTFLQSYDSGEGTRLYVTCFDAGQIYVFDPDVPRLIAVVNAGRGPAGLAFPRTPRADRKERLAYIVGFAANDIGVLDLTPGSETQYHVVQRIGFPSLVPR
ncbi:MAG TPA: hypothetical protein VMT47_06745 [Polyangia bacterium]|nr:hypothetical protein [Polyangia bacterium]